MKTLIVRQVSPCTILVFLLALLSTNLFAESGEDDLIEEFNHLVREYRFAEAQGVLDRAVTAHPGNVLFPMQLVSFKATLRGYVDVQQNIITEEAATNPGRALRSAQRILAVQPEHERAKSVVAMLSNEVSRRIEPLLEQCKKEMQRGETDAARETLANLLSLDPTEPRIRILLNTMEERSEDHARAQEEEVRKTLTKIEVMNKSSRLSVTRKEDVNRLQRAVERGLVQKPGDEHLVALARRAQEVLSKGASKDEQQVSQSLAKTVASYGESSEQQMEKGKRFLSDGRFSEAEAIFSGLVRSGGLTTIAISYIYQGIARLAQTRVADISMARQQQLKARGSFVNALRFDGNATLPAGYEKYARELSEARQLL
mgnify:CR=1 FL=1